MVPVPKVNYYDVVITKQECIFKNTICSKWLHLGKYNTSVGKHTPQRPRRQILQALRTTQSLLQLPAVPAG